MTLYFEQLLDTVEIVLIQFLESMVDSSNEKIVSRPKEGQYLGHPYIGMVQKKRILSWRHVVDVGLFKHSVVSVFVVLGYQVSEMSPQKNVTSV